MQSEALSKDVPFLQGGGEMGELTRSFDWSTSTLGTPDQWPQTMRTSLSILLHSKFPMFLFWGDDLICFYNDAYRPSLGNDGKHPAVGKKGADVWPEIWPVIKPLIDQVQSTMESSWSEDQLIPIYRNGKLEDVYWTFSYSPVMNELGNTAGVFVTCVETTGKVQNLHKLEESEARYRSLFNSMDQGFCVFEMIFDASGAPVDYRFLEINAVFEAQTGLKNAVGKTARELVPDLEKKWFELYGRIATSGQTERFIQGSSAMGRWFDVNAFRVGDPAARKVALLFTDITERQLADEKLRLSEQNLRNTILQAPVAMCIFKGPDFVVEIANERMLEFWGKGSLEVLGRPIFEGLPEARGQGFEALLMSVYSTGETVKAYGVPVKLPRNGTIDDVYVDFVYEAYHEENGTISGVLAVAVEVTEQVRQRKKIEESEIDLQLRVAERTRELIESNEELQKFAHVASHDLKEPVRKIRIFLSRLKMQYEEQLPEKANLFLGKIESAASRMSAMIDGVLLYSSLSALQQDVERVDLNNVMSQIREDLEIAIEEKKAQVIADRLPVIEGSAVLLYQLFYNLLNNALKFTKADTTPVVRISSILSDKNVVIDIEDNGIGFRQQYAEDIFDSFVRLNAKDKFEGTGLGLALCDKIAQRHGGTITAKGTEGEGAVFTVTLPLLQA